MGWLLFLAAILLLGLAAMPSLDQFSRVADLGIITLRLALVITLSVLVVRKRWRYGNQSGSIEGESRRDRETVC